MQLVCPNEEIFDYVQSVKRAPTGIGDFRAIPLVRKDPFAALAAKLSGHERVLDWGAGSFELRDAIQRVFPAAKYFSYDINTTFSPDFSRWEQLQKERFDWVALNSVLEHLDWKEADETIGQIASIADRVFISVPNVYGPFHVFGNSPFHVRQYSPHAIHYLLEKNGFAKTSFFRVSLSKWDVLRHFATYLTQQDFAAVIIGIGQKTVSAPDAARR